MNLSASQIIPPEFQDQLMQYGETGDISSWGIGDIGAVLEDELPGVPKGKLHNAIGQFCNRSSETVRDYVYTSRRVPKVLRDEYDMLGRHHHKAIADYAKGDIHLHRDYCERVLEKMDDFGGNIMPVGTLREWLQRENGVPSPEILWNQRTEKAALRWADASMDKEAKALYNTIAESANAILEVLDES